MSKHVVCLCITYLYAEDCDNFLFMYYSFVLYIYVTYIEGSNLDSDFHNSVFEIHRYVSDSNI